MSNQALTRLPELSPEETALMVGDLSLLDEAGRASLIQRVCASLGLNPLTRPFEYLMLDNKLTLYARKDCAEQLRRIYDVNCQIVSRQEEEGIYEVVVRATLPSGRFDEDMGAVSVVKEGGTWKQAQSGKRYLEKDGTLTRLAGDDLINARKRAVTQAKRRTTLSICGLGMLEESDLELIPGAIRIEEVPPITPPSRQIAQEASTVTEQVAPLDDDAAPITVAIAAKLEKAEQTLHKLTGEIDDPVELTTMGEARARQKDILARINKARAAQVSAPNLEMAGVP